MTTCGIVSTVPPTCTENRHEAARQSHAPVHPGGTWREDYLAPLNLSANAVTVALSVPSTCIHEIVNERCGISADTAKRLARYFGGDAVSWLNLQTTYDLKTLPTRKEILRRVEPRAA